MYCYKCGTEIQDGVSYCYTCEAQLNPDQIIPNQMNSEMAVKAVEAFKQANIQIDKNSKKIKYSIALTVIGIGLVLCLTGIGLLFGIPTIIAGIIIYFIKE